MKLYFRFVTHLIMILFCLIFFLFTHYNIQHFKHFFAQNFPAE